MAQAAAAHLDSHWNQKEPMEQREEQNRLVAEPQLRLVHLINASSPLLIDRVKEAGSGVLPQPVQENPLVVVVVPHLHCASAVQALHPNLADWQSLNLAQVQIAQLLQIAQLIRLFALLVVLLLGQRLHCLVQKNHQSLPLHEKFHFFHHQKVCYMLHR